jgi:succinate dehydrogenase/fumarate reductase-like Fe-S protein
MEILKVYEERDTREVTSDKCVHCYHCVDSCPEEGCLSVEFLGRKVLASKYRCQCDEGGVGR